MKRGAALERLRNGIRKLDSVAVAFSGGVDSSLVAKVAHDELGRKAVAMMAVSELVTKAEVSTARRVAKSIGIKFLTVKAHVLDNEGLVASPPDRCYICKRLIFSALEDGKRRLGLACLVDGTNAEDALTDRPGTRASKELSVRSPLAEVGLTKGDVRRLARRLGVVSADRPSSPCLATRIPFGERIDLVKLRQVAVAEGSLRSLGFAEVRVRHHGDVARIEVPQDDLIGLLRKRDEAVKRVKAAGFVYVALDLQGYRSGSMEEALASQRKRRKGSHP